MSAVQTVLEATVPIFAVMGVGYGVARVTPSLHAPTLAHLAMVITSPALVFSQLSRISVPPDRWLRLGGGVLWIMALTAFLAILCAGRKRLHRRALLLPSVFWNAGNMGLPCAHLAFGDPGLQAATIVFVVVVLVQSTAGIAIAKGHGGKLEILRQPLFHASVAGILVSSLDITVPNMIGVPIQLLGDMAIPLMLLNLGVQLHTLVVKDLRHAGIAVAIRMGGGLSAAWLFVTWFGCEGIDRQVLILSGALPAAVINIVLAQKYGTEPALVASSIVLGTLVALVSAPTVLYFLLAG